LTKGAIRRSERIERLRAQLAYHDYRYYILDSPEISDAEYDELMAQLRALEEQYPEFVTPESPTQQVGAPPAETFSIVQHRIPLLSLSNVFNHEQLVAWYRRTSGFLEGRPFTMVCEHKIDGLAVALTYESGRFSVGATRGDGYRGENVTRNMAQGQGCANNRSTASPVTLRGPGRGLYVQGWLRAPQRGASGPRLAALRESA
jgi:DNA ligase (NAD+)